MRYMMIAVGVVTALAAAAVGITKYRSSGDTTPEAETHTDVESEVKHDS